MAGLQAVQQHLAMVTGLLEQTAGLQQRASALLPATEQDEAALVHALMDALHSDAGSYKDDEGNLGFPVAGTSAEAAVSGNALEEHAEFEDAHEDLTSSVAEPTAEKVIVAASSQTSLLWAGCLSQSCWTLQLGIHQVPVQVRCGLSVSVPFCRLLSQRQSRLLLRRDGGAWGLGSATRPWPVLYMIQRRNLQVAPEELPLPPTLR